MPSSKSLAISVTPCGTRRGGENFGSGCAGSGAQSLRASETSTKPARSVSDGMAGEVGDGQHLVAQRGHQQQIDLGEDARHLVGDFAAEAVGLDEVDGGEEARLAEDVRPGVGDLRLQLVDCVVERELLEGRGGFGEEDQVERVVGPVGKRDFDRHHAELLHGV